MGRIGRATMRNLIDDPDMELVAINDIIPIGDLAYLLRYDSVYGPFDRDVKTEGSDLVVEERHIRYCQERDPSNLPWKELKIDLVLECSGFFNDESALEKHRQAGADKVILSAPPKGGHVPMVVFGVNEIPRDVPIISAASCTTNCIAPVVEVVGRRLGLRKALMTTIHAYTSSQGIVDTHNKNLRRGRAAAINFVPTSTGAARATTKVITELAGKFDGLAIRGPVPSGSIADITMVLENSTSVDELNQILGEEANSERYREVLAVSHEELVSSDILKNPHGSIVDATSTQVVDGDLVKVLAWYDNEWGYVKQLLRLARSF